MNELEQLGILLSPVSETNCQLPSCVIGASVKCVTRVSNPAMTPSLFLLDVPFTSFSAARGHRKVSGKVMATVL